MQPSAERSAYLHSVQTKADGGLPAARSVDQLLVQRKGEGAPADREGAVQDIAAVGVEGTGQRLPHLDRIQDSFGTHDVAGVQSHVGGTAAQASQALGARAYATGNSVAFKSEPDLHLAAHEAAHVVQQRAGVQLSGGVGRSGDAYEQHADAVADAVVSGRSAQGLLDQMAGGGAQDRSGVQRAVQKDDDPGGDPGTGDTHPLLELGAHGQDVMRLQQLLNDKGQQPPLAADGWFGRKTAAAVRAFQKKNGLQSTGVVDDATWTALEGGGVGPASDQPEIEANQEQMGQHMVDKMNTANTGPYGLDAGIHYSYNFEAECQQAGRMDLWKDEYRMGYANPQYFTQNGFMDWTLKPGVSASEGIKAWLHGLTVAECNSSVVAMEIDTMRAAIGDKKFDDMFGAADKQIPDGQRLRVKPGTDGTPVGNYMKTTDLNNLHAQKAGQGQQVSEEEINKTIHPGEWYYFYNHPKYLLKHPGGAWQGENSLFMGWQGDQRLWAGLGASNVTEEGMIHEMLSAYNRPRDKEDERAMKERGIKQADGTYADAKYDPQGGEFANAVTKDNILNDPAYTLDGVSRKGGFLMDAGMTLDVDKIKQVRDQKDGAGGGQ